MHLYQQHPSPNHKIRRHYSQVGAETHNGAGYIQINALDFDPDINGPNIPRAHNNAVVVSVPEWLTSPEPELSDATNFQEENTDRDPPNTTYNNSEEFHGHDNFSQHIPNHTPVQHFTGQHQITSRHNIDSEEIPQLEEDWDNG